MAIHNNITKVMASHENVTSKVPKRLVPQLRFKEFEGEWEESTIGKVSNIKGRIGYRGYTVNDIVEKGNGAITLSPSNFIDNRINIEKATYISWEKYKESPEIMIFNGDILFVKTGSTYGKTAFVQNLNEPATINPQIVVLKNITVSNVFLSFIVISTTIKKQVESIVVGGAIPTMSQRELEKMKFLIPSLPEQQKIAQFLTAVDSKLQQLKQKKELLEQYKKGVMQQLFSQQLRFKQDDGSDYPDWEEKRLGDVSYITTGSSNRVDSSLDGEYTFFDRSEDIRTSSIYLFDDEAVIVPGEGQNFIPKYFIGKFDLHQRTYAIMKFENCLGKFIYYHLAQHPNYLLSQSVGSTVKSLRLPMFKKMKINFPSTEEQQKIASYLNAIDTKIDTDTQQIEATQQFKKGLLQQMFV
ncbi:type I restriction enzyme S subunit [Mesoflavibacter sabulilitoris]|uniref:Type I restriction modification DNA specificity domain-containing protein n=1 Tax=Mesoflavibacter zeaxanthinifaciens subsp. sabulilitoris TaxID=1520893 RepID=A0A2T1NLY7_9FLAO|nr:restriction endonuclease subunit S [Mesoflavibacter zeaxanthinifaciens]MBB3124540.1 type I restriction enzyme S subunit [Mesoflavibacter zeaxanthinifaciens subsp. sabulilitoris]PSG93908.1 hypothetical protein C7H61_01675 [Mesoflavibacter zeaxanthinifaciens subsp. sabulilitoris]